MCADKTFPMLSDWGTHQPTGGLSPEQKRACQEHGAAEPAWRETGEACAESTLLAGTLALWSPGLRPLPEW